MKITMQTYKTAADRIRRGREQPMDATICDEFDRQSMASTVRSVMDLPIARRMWRGDARDAR